MIREAISSRGNLMRLLLVVFALIFPGKLLAQSPVISLADGRDGTIFFASSTPTGLDQYLETTQTPETVVSAELRLPAGTERVFHDNGRLRELRLARSDSVLGRRYDAGTLLRFDRDGWLIYVQP
jgi:hypothetical protein